MSKCDAGALTDRRPCAVSNDAKDAAKAILGPHADVFFIAMGRIVCVSACLEEKLTALRHALASEHQGRFTQQAVSVQIVEARKLLGRLPISDAAAVSAYLDRVGDAFKKRNEYVHSSFPAQSDGRLWGHRPTRDKTIIDGTADTIDTSPEEMDMFILHLAGLVKDFNQIFARCSNLSPRTAED